VRPLLLFSALAAMAVTAGCVARDMRDEYVANRELSEATADLSDRAPQYRHVLGHLEPAFRLRGGDPRFAARLAGLYLGLGRYQRALRCYEAASRTARGEYDLERAVCRLGLGQRDQALSEIDRIMADAARKRYAGILPPLQYAVMLNLAGYTMVDEGVRLKEALDMIEEAVRLVPLEATFIDSLGWAYYRLGRYQDAAFHLERAARLSEQDNAEVLWHLGAVHARTGQWRRANRELVLALKLDPDNTRARQALERLRRELPVPARV